MLLTGETAFNNDYQKKHDLILISTKTVTMSLHVKNHVAVGYCPSLFCFKEITFKMQAWDPYRKL
jgi:hypothetical protein